MKLKTLAAFTFLIAIAMAFMMPDVSTAQDNPTQSYSKSNTYVKITWDTTDLTVTPYLRNTSDLKSGIITNQSATIDMEVMFSRLTYNNGRDSLTYVRIPPGKTFEFTTRRKKVFRRMLSSTAGDSAKSQVILGPVKLSLNENDSGSQYFAAATFENDSGFSNGKFNKARDWIRDEKSLFVKKQKNEPKT